MAMAAGVKLALHSVLHDPVPVSVLRQALHHCSFIYFMLSAKFLQGLCVAVAALEMILQGKPLPDG